VILDPDKILSLSEKTMLGAEQGGQGHAGGGGEQVGRVIQSVIHGGGVTDQPDAEAAQRFPILVPQDIEPGAHTDISISAPARSEGSQ
jgi:hypothetical protein